MAWTVSDIPSQAGRLAVVTGPTGLGYETALALAQAGATVIVAGRNPQTGEASAAKIRGLAPGADARFERLDLASLASVGAFANRMIAAGTPIDLLVNNAGVMMPPKRQVTADGFELQFGTNYLGHFALTAALLPLLRQGRDPRVVSLSSIAATNASLHFDDLQFAKRYGPTTAYGQSKLAMLMFAYELQRRSDAAGWGIKSFAAHPGIARTDLIAKGAGPGSALAIASRLFGGLMSQSAAQGALPTLLAATSPTAKAGAYYGPDGMGGLKGAPVLVKPPSQALDTAAAARLWEVSEQLAGVRFGQEAVAA